MLAFKKSALGNVTRSRTALAVIAATLQIGKRDRGSTCHTCGNTSIEGLIYASIQKVGTGKCNPVAHGARCYRRNSSDRKTGQGFHLPHMWQYFYRGTDIC